MTLLYLKICRFSISKSKSKKINFYHDSSINIFPVHKIGEHNRRIFISTNWGSYWVRVWPRSAGNKNIRSAKQADAKLRAIDKYREPSL